MKSKCKNHCTNINIVLRCPCKRNHYVKKGGVDYKYITYRMYFRRGGNKKHITRNKFASKRI